MNLEKAIEINSQRIIYQHSASQTDEGVATKLGLEALQRIQECRLADHTIAEDYLPSETHD